MIKQTPSFRSALCVTSATLLAAVGGAFLAPASTQAQTKAVISTVHNFDGGGDTGTTQGQIKGSDGNFYGCSYDGGIKNSGFVYKLTPTGTFTVLHNFQNDGSAENDPLEGEKPKELIQGADGNLYGICRGGGAEINTGGVGTFWKLTISGTPAFTKLYDFDNGDPNAGAFPSAIVQGKDGKFYGLTRDGGASGLSDGTYFRITTNGTKAGTTRTELFAFKSGDGPGYAPEAQLLVASDGNFYGQTNAGGSTGGGGAGGTIFKATTSGSVTRIHGFFGDTAPLGHQYPLIQAKDGFLYGTANTGGEAPSYGVIFKCGIDGTYTVLHNFSDSQVDGVSPYCALVQATDGNFYGSVSEGFFHDPTDIVDGPGAYFQITPSGVFTTIVKLTEGSTAPQKPFGNLTEVTPGVFFGVTANGANGDGAIIKLTTSPTIVSSTVANATIGVSFSYGIRTYQTVTSYSATGLPPGLGASTTTGMISGKPTTAGTYSVALKATNAAGTGTATLKITVTGPKPVITSATTATATQGTSFSYSITASNSPTSYGASGLPSGLTLSTSTGKITGTPKTAGIYSVTIAAFNSGGSGSAKLTLTVKGAPPKVTSATAGTATVGTAYSYQIVATNSPTKYGASGLPSGLTLNQTTGKISGTPTKAGTYVVTIAAFNATGSGSTKLTLTVKAAAAKPVITSSLNPGSRQGVPFSYQITATNSPTKYGTSGLPSGLTINQTTGKINGTPTKAGTYSVTIAAFNSAGTGSAKLTLVVKPPA